MTEWEGLGARIPSRDLEHERVRQQLLGLDAEFAGEGPNFIGEKFATLPSKLDDAVFS